MDLVDGAIRSWWMSFDGNVHIHFDEDLAQEVLGGLCAFIGGLIAVEVGCGGIVFVFHRLSFLRLPLVERRLIGLGVVLIVESFERVVGGARGIVVEGFHGIISWYPAGICRVFRVR